MSFSPQGRIASFLTAFDPEAESQLATWQQDCYPRPKERRVLALPVCARFKPEKCDDCPGHHAADSCFRCETWAKSEAYLFSSAARRWCKCQTAQLAKSRSFFTPGKKVTTKR